MDIQDFLDQGEGKEEEEDKIVAWNLFQQAYELQMKGQLEEAVDVYQQSLATFPTAEAHTFLGWTYSFMGQLNEAIEECHRAIRQDPDFGNPYNDIGAYLIELNQLEEAIPWLEKAGKATRYENPSFPHMNLGRVYERQSKWDQAIESYKKSLALNPEYKPAKQALMRIITLMN
ncbi:MAG: tetratricopeptide repeat protein [Nitrospirota bacterium]|nr:tetratricopeptide repeat protein [Nitrospirota bacterium]